MNGSHAEHPVVVVAVVRPEETARAVEWAAGYVRRCGGSLHLVGAWSGRVQYGLPPLMATYDPEPAAHAAVQAAAAAARLNPDRVRTEVVRGRIGRELIRLSELADVIVIGSSTRRSLSRRLLGSLDGECARRASCPVVVIPAPTYRRSSVSRRGPTSLDDIYDGAGGRLLLIEGARWPMCW
jgi:nucleotide-binding universal stress UspA family protein